MMRSKNPICQQAEVFCGQLPAVITLLFQSLPLSLPPSDAPLLAFLFPRTLILPFFSLAEQADSVSEESFHQVLLLLLLLFLLVHASISHSCFHIGTTHTHTHAFLPLPLSTPVDACPRRPHHWVKCTPPPLLTTRTNSDQVRSD